jgi:hypothetical protein
MKKENFKKVIVINYLKNNQDTVELELKAGVLIKINNFYENGRNYYNYWGLILAYKNEEYKVVVQVAEKSYDIIYIKYENIKHIIGTLEMDCVNIGKNRHEKEVVGLINDLTNFFEKS